MGPYTGFILNLENRAFLRESQGNPEIVQEFSIIFIQVKEKSGKANYLFHISFSLTTCMVVHKVVVSFAVSKSGVDPEIFRQGVDSSNEGAKILFLG